MRRVRRPVTEELLRGLSRRNANGCLIWQRTGDEYGRIRARNHKRRVHRVMWELRNGAIPRGMCVLHSCDTPLCIEPLHLFLGTRADNNADRDRKGRQAAPRGEANGAAKLTAADVMVIRGSAGAVSQTELAARFGVTCGAIWRIVHRRTWRHLIVEQGDGRPAPLAARAR